MRARIRHKAQGICIGVLISWASCLLQPASAAEPAPPTPAAPEATSKLVDPSKTAENDAEEAYNSARAFSKKKQWGAALLQFQASARLFPSWKARTGIGASLEKLQRYDEALDVYESTLRDFGDLLPAPTKTILFEQIDIMRKETGALMITGATPGALVLVDGRLRGEHPLPAPVATLAGRHLIRVYKEGFSVHEQDVAITRGGMETLAVALKPLENAGRLDVGDVKGRKMEVVVDGVPVGETPWSGPVSPGPHVVFLRAITPRGDARRGVCGDLIEEGAKGVVTSLQDIELGSEPVTVNVEPGKSTAITLKAEPLDAFVRVMPSPPTAEVILDGLSVGRGPFEARTRKGKHRVRLVADGYLPLAEEFEARPGDEVALALALRRDLNAPRWALHGRFLVEGRGAVALAPSLGGEAAAACGAECLQSLGVGVRAALRVGYELPSGFGFGGSVGYFSINQTRTNRQVAIRVDAETGGSTRDMGRLNETTSIDGFTIGVNGSYRLGRLFPVRVGLGAGFMLSGVSSSRVGIFDNRGTGSVTQSGFFPWLYVEPEVDIGVRITEGLSVGVSFSGMLILAPRIPVWRESMSLNAHSANPDQIGAFAAESITGAAFFAMTQGLHVRYGF